MNEVHFILYCYVQHKLLCGKNSRFVAYNKQIFAGDVYLAT